MLDSSHESQITASHLPKLPPEAFLGLLTEPPGAYGRAKHGNSMAFTLRGSLEFLWKAKNLFSSFGGETTNGSMNAGVRARISREIVFHLGNDKECLYFCMSPERFRKAIFLYLYGRLVHLKGDWKRDYDEEGSFLGAECLNEKDLEEEAWQLTFSFYTNEIGLDYRAIPEYAFGAGLVEHEFHGSIA